MRADDIDPQLPYIQVHRSVSAKAAQLASVLGVTHQHALGALCVLWESLADRRLLAGRTEIVLGREDLEARLELAFGRPLAFRHLVAVGVLEPRGDAFRVRGMSRYLDAEAKRTRAKRPTSTPPEVDLRSPPAPPEPHLDPTSAPQRIEDRGERIEARGKRKKARGESDAAAGQPALPGLPETPPNPPPELTPAVQVYRRFEEDRAARLEDLGAPPVPLPAPNWAHIGAVVATWSKLGEELLGPGEGLLFAKNVVVRSYLEDPYWAGATHRETKAPEPYPWNALASEKVWRPLVEKQRQELHGERGAA